MYNHKTAQIVNTNHTPSETRGTVELTTIEVYLFCSLIPRLLSVCAIIATTFVSPLIMGLKVITCNMHAEGSRKTSYNNYSYIIYNIGYTMGMVYSQCILGI